MRIGVTLGGPMAGLKDLAATVEGLGYDSVWTAETGSTAFIQAAVVAQATSRVRVGTAIALAFPRSPGVAAMTAIDLDELSGGRFICGLGSQVKRVNEGRFSTPFEHPAPKMREYALAMRAFIGGHFGEEPNFEGRFYRITMAPWPRVPPPVRRDIPIYFAAVNEHMQRAAGEVADGVIGHPMTSVDYINKVVLPAIAKGAAKAGRKPEGGSGGVAAPPGTDSERQGLRSLRDNHDCELVQQVIVSISDDREEAKQAAKQQVGFYATTRTYAPVLAMHGFEGLVDDLREAFATKDMSKLASIVPDEMVDTYALFGTAGEVVEKARRFEGVVGELCLGMPWYRVDPGFMASNYRAMLQAFAR